MRPYQTGVVTEHDRNGDTAFKNGKKKVQRIPSMPASPFPMYMQMSRSNYTYNKCRDEVRETQEILNHEVDDHW